MTGLGSITTVNRSYTASWQPNYSTQRSVTNTVLKKSITVLHKGLVAIVHRLSTNTLFYIIKRRLHVPLPLICRDRVLGELMHSRCQGCVQLQWSVTQPHKKSTTII